MSRYRPALSTVVTLAGAVVLLGGGLTVLTVSPAAAVSSFASPCFASPNVREDGVYTVPDGVAEVRAVLRGQNGGAGNPNDARTAGGKGATLVVEFPVTAGQRLSVGHLVGAPGGTTPDPQYVAGNWYVAHNGGNGGDAQYVSTAGADGCQHALAVAAGGGGGSGRRAIGGNADAGSGATAGQNGDTNDQVDGAGGGAASSTGGGFGGNRGSNALGECHDGNSGSAGGFLQGGAGGNAASIIAAAESCLYPAHGAGGGGAGYYYGGGGGSAYASGTWYSQAGADHSPGAGGGGSSYLDLSVTKISLTAGATPGLPIAAPVYDTATTISSSPNPSYSGRSVTITSHTTTVGTNDPVRFGSVEIRSGGTLLTTLAVGADGGATWTTQDLPVGDDVLSATFLSTEDSSVAYRASSSAGGTQTVHPCAPAPVFSGQPADVQATTGTTTTVNATVSVSPLFEGVPVMRWQVSSDNGTTWTDAAGTSSVQTAGVTPGYGLAIFTYAVTGGPRLVEYRAIASTCGGSVTSSPATLTVRAIDFDLTNLPAKTFGSAPFDVAGYATRSTVPVAFSSETTPVCTVTGTTVTVVAAGICTLSADESGSSDYAAAPQVRQSFTTGKKSITVTAVATPLSQPFGTSTGPTVACRPSGFLGKDTYAVSPLGEIGDYLGDPLRWRPITGNWDLLPRGTHTSHCSGGDPGPNYQISSYINGTFTITAPLPPALKITADSASYVYGEVPPTLGATYSTTATLTGTLSCRAYTVTDLGFAQPLTLSDRTPAGTYATHCSGQSSTSYTVSYVDGKLTVGKAPVAVTASSPASQVYGETSAPQITCSATGFLDEDGFVTEPTGVVRDLAGTEVLIGADAAVGSYTTACTGGEVGSNYTITDRIPGTFTIEDRTGPVLSVPDGLVVEATSGAGATATFAATALDAVDGPTAVTCTPMSGSTFPLGATTVSCTSTDEAANRSGTTFDVTVVDTVAPETSITGAPVGPTARTGAEVAFDGTDVVGVRGYECSLDDGEYEPCESPKLYAGLDEGSHTFSVRAWDAAGNVDLTPASAAWVVDLTPPVLTLPAAPIVDATAPDGATVTYAPATATDAAPAAPAVSCSPGSGSTFAIGTTQVTCSATDAAGNTGTATFTVTVKGQSAQLVDLEAEVQSLPRTVSAGTRKSLLALLESAQAAVARGNESAACDKLTSFISQVASQSGKKIPTAAATHLILGARRIQAVLGCG